MKINMTGCDSFELSSSLRGRSRTTKMNSTGVSLGTSRLAAYGAAVRRCGATRRERCEEFSAVERRARLEKVQIMSHETKTRNGERKRAELSCEGIK
jgi:hypothetical protein